MKHYSTNDKEAIVRRMMPPNPVSVSMLSSETGVPKGTLYTWKTQYQTQGQAVPASNKRPEHWAAQDKLAIVCEAHALKGTELGEYCRKKGLFPEQIKAWEEAALRGYQRQEQLDKQQVVQNKEDRLTIQKLEAELRRKEAALAETAALLVLSKKSQAIWGDSGEN
jgi:transposase